MSTEASDTPQHTPQPSAQDAPSAMPPQHTPPQGAAHNSSSSNNNNGNSNGSNSSNNGSNSNSNSNAPQLRRPRTGTIVWGVLVLAFCAYMAFQIMAPGSVDGTAFVIAGTIGLGVILLAVGAVVIVRSARNSRK